MKKEEVSMVDEILSTPQGRAMMKCVEERDELRNLLDKANTLLIDASCMRKPSSDAWWMKEFGRFREAYEASHEQWHAS